MSTILFPKHIIISYRPKKEKKNAIDRKSPWGSLLNSLTFLQLNSMCTVYIRKLNCMTKLDRFEGFNFVIFQFYPFKQQNSLIPILPLPHIKKKAFLVI
jgi:hypothetical protein